MNCVEISVSASFYEAAGNTQPDTSPVIGHHVMEPQQKRNKHLTFTCQCIKITLLLHAPFLSPCFLVHKQVRNVSGPQLKLHYCVGIWQSIAEGLKDITQKCKCLQWQRALWRSDCEDLMNKPGFIIHRKMFLQQSVECPPPRELYLGVSREIKSCCVLTSW